MRWGLKIQREAKERNEIQGMLEKPQGQNKEKENERIKERNRIHSDYFSHTFNEIKNNNMQYCSVYSCLRNI